MSYDYNALLLKIHHHRRAKEWQGAVETFSTLSMHCPMTPLLWIQYAHDNGQLLLDASDADALEVQLNTLEIGLGEFPGCALLQLHYVELLLQELQSKGGTILDKAREGFENALDAVGRGSHRNEDVLVVQIYQRYATFAADHLPGLDALSIFVRRSKVPMQQANDSILSEMEAFAHQKKLTITQEHRHELENNRRYVATLFQSLYTLEDDVDEAMQNEQILPRFSMDLASVDWQALIATTTSQFWMGLGGASTAHAFIKYAQVCASYPKQHLARGQLASQPDDLQFVNSLAVPIYERAVSECPTVDAVWLAYLKALSWLVTKRNRVDLAGTLQSVADRAYRNCPYSLEVAKCRIGTSFTLAMVRYSVLDPDALAQMVSEIIDATFLTDVLDHLQLYKTAIQTVKRRILFLLAPSTYDEPLDRPPSNVNSEALTEAAGEEIQDLIEDLRELYDTTDKYMCKKNCTNGRALLWMGRSKTERYLLSPLMAVLDGGLDVAFDSNAESVRCFDKLLKIHIHPDSFRSYIQMVLTHPLTSPQEVTIKFRRMRHFFQNGLQSTAGKFDGDFLTELARQNLCNEYLQFEQLFGSDKSLEIAQRLVQKVLPPRMDHQTDRATKKRKQEVTPSQALMEKSQESQSKKINLGEISKDSTEAQNSVEDYASYMNSVEPIAMDTTEMDFKADASNDKVADPKTLNEIEMDSKPAALHDQDEPACTDTTAKEGSSARHKVKIGKLEFPAHPWTIRVSNLSPETEDMDLVDTFRPRCGAIVHAKIMREKHHHHNGKGASKGWGLVQFENQESVDKALELHDIIGLHEKILRIERSHMPAASLVPPGMHRVHPKGEGKFSKRNAKVKEIGAKGINDNDETTLRTESASIEVSAPESGQESTLEKAGHESATNKGLSNASNAGLLAFQPRGVARRKLKVKLMK